MQMFDGQILPHAPQFVASLSTEMHLPRHATSGATHWTVDEGILEPEAGGEGERHQSERGA